LGKGDKDGKIEASYQLGNNEPFEHVCTVNIQMIK